VSSDVFPSNLQRRRSFLSIFVVSTFGSPRGTYIISLGQLEGWVLESRQSGVGPLGACRALALLGHVVAPPGISPASRCDP
jgi:hypothetical protein